MSLSSPPSKVSSPALPTIMSLPAIPSMRLSFSLPMRTSLNCEPMIFSRLVRISVVSKPS